MRSAHQTSSADRQANPEAEASLRSAFDRFSATLNRGDLDGFLALFDADAVIIDEDLPFRVGKREFVDHLGFHGRQIWESFSWVPRSVRIEVFGSTGLVVGGATFRGKPIDSGYRLRHMLQTMGWTLGPDRIWRIVLFHQSPMIGHLADGSPG